MRTNSPGASYSIILTLAACLLAGCAEPEPEEAEEPGAAAIACPQDIDEHPRSIALGAADEEGFVPFEPGDTLAIIDGLQGGTWVMPAAVFRVASLRGDLDAKVVLSSGEVLGAIEGVSTKLTPSKGGGELPYIPIPIGHFEGQPTADAADGRPGELHVRFEDACGGVTEASVQVMLEYERTAEAP